jgi:hypothetical protein
LLPSPATLTAVISPATYKNIALEFYHIPQKNQGSICNLHLDFFAMEYEIKVSDNFYYQFYYLIYITMKNINGIACQLLNC